MSPFVFLYRDIIASRHLFVNTLEIKGIDLTYEDLKFLGDALYCAGLYQMSLGPRLKALRFRLAVVEETQKNSDKGEFSKHYPPRLHEKVAESYYRLGDWKSAVEYYEKAKSQKNYSLSPIDAKRLIDSEAKLMLGDKR